MRRVNFLISAGLGVALAVGHAAAQDSTTRIGEEPAPSNGGAAVTSDTARISGSFVLEETVEICAGCHGEDGQPIEVDIPVIWGQQYFYLYTQLKDYAAARRHNEIMTPIASEFSRQQMKAIAQYFADKPWPTIAAHAQDGDSAIANRGITGGQCSACHGKWGGDSRIPRLAGQQAGYLARTMNDFKNDVRQNAPDKNSTMSQLDDSTIEALARYLSAL